jgi:hypothetical protein
MTRGRVARLIVAILALAGGFIWIHRTSIDANRVSLYVAATIGAVSVIYALFTYEILLQNQSMAKAAVDSVALTERALRFSYTESLLFQTINTKDPLFRSRGDILPVENEDYARALAEQGEEQQQKEYVFAIVKNMGRGAATTLNLRAEYTITDSSSANRRYVVNKQATVQVLEPNKAIALCVFLSKVPTGGDQVQLVSATITSSNFYRDALREPPQQLIIDINTHKVECEQTCVVQVL